MKPARQTKVLAALRDSESLRWYEMPDSVGFSTLNVMEKHGLIERVPDGAGPYSLRARWRLKPQQQ